MAHSSRLSDPEYVNWVTVGQAIEITCDGLETVVQKAVDNYHTRLLAKLPKKVNRWKQHLKKAYRSKDKTKIQWKNSVTKKWFTAGKSWEIAKIFMSYLGERKHVVVNAHTTDIAGLLNILEWSPRGSNGMFNVGVVPSTIANARHFRNIWAHAPRLRITDAEKADAFTSFTALLQDGELSHDKDAQDAINELHKLLNDGLAVIEIKELELLIKLQYQLAQDLVSYMNEKQQVDAKRIQDLMKSLDEFLRENKLQNAMKKKLDEHVQSTNYRLMFNPVCDRMKEGFVGREWLFNDIDSWLEKDLRRTESRAFSIRGGPGTGKSSIARELLRRQEGKKLIGYHFFQWDNPLTCQLESLADNLSCMLSTNLPAYANWITQSNWITKANKFRDYPKKLFHHLLTTPLQQLEESPKCFLLISALDEGGEIAASCFATLSKNLPPWLRIIFTARNNATALLSLFPDCTCANLDLDTIDTQSITSLTIKKLEEDMHSFVIMKYDQLQDEYRDNIPPFFKDSQVEAIEKLVKQSRYCFLYAKLVMEHIFTHQDEFVSLPPTLLEFYSLDFSRLIPDKTDFKEKVAPVLEVVFAIERANTKLLKDMQRRVVQWLWDALGTSGTFLKRVVEMNLLSGITSRDMRKAVELLSVYLCKDSYGVFCFSHLSVKIWLQMEQSNFFCDVIKGHSIMAKFHLEMLKTYPADPRPSLVRYLYHSSFLSEKPESMDVNLFISELGIKLTDLLDAGLAHTKLEDFAIKVLEENDVLDKMSLQEKAEHLYLAVTRNRKRVAAKLISTAYWIFNFEVNPDLTYLEHMTNSLDVLQEKGCLPQLVFSVLCGEDVHREMVEFWVDQGVMADVCVPRFFKNTEKFDVRICWNGDVQEYFRKLKSGEKNIITLESLKEKPSSPDEAQIDDYTLEIIQKPISEVELLVTKGECYVCFTYGWHVMALNRDAVRDLTVIDVLLKHGANVNNKGDLGKTALMMACEMQDCDLISFLLDHNAKVNEQDFYGSTALHHALERNENSEVERNSDTQVHIIEMLLERDADPHLQDSKGVSAIVIAEREGGVLLEKLKGKTV